MSREEVFVGEAPKQPKARQAIHGRKREVLNRDRALVLCVVKSYSIRQKPPSHFPTNRIAEKTFEAVASSIRLNDPWTAYID